MNRYLLFLTTILTISQIYTSHAEIRISGYYKNFFTTFDTPYTDEPLTGAVVNRLRLNLTYNPTDTLSCAFAYDFAPRIQDPSLFTESPFAIGTTSSRYRLVDFHSRIYPTEDELIGSVGIYHNLDRASVQISTEFADISIGREAIAWGSARIINPTDVVAPYNFDQLDTEERIGVDAVRIRIPVGVLGEIDSGYIIGDNFEFEKSAIFLRTQFNTFETDFSMILLEYQKDLLIGLDIARGIGGAGFWLETSYLFIDPLADVADTYENYLRGSIGIDYSFGGETYTFIEYHFNGVNSAESQNLMKHLEHPAYERGGVYLLGNHYLAPGVSHQLTPLINLSGQMLLNLSDMSTWIAPQIAYNVAEDVHLSLGCFFSFGKPPLNDDPNRYQSEFGLYPNLFFSSFSIYF